MRTLTMMHVAAGLLLCEPMAVAAHPDTDPKSAAIRDFPDLVSKKIDAMQKYSGADAAWMNAYVDTVEALRPVYTSGCQSCLKDAWNNIHPGVPYGTDPHSMDARCSASPELYAISESARIQRGGDASQLPQCAPEWLKKAADAIGYMSTVMRTSYLEGQRDAFNYVNRRLASVPSQPARSIAEASFAEALMHAAGILGSPPPTSQTIGCLSNRVGDTTLTTCH